MAQMKKQIKTPEKELNKMEINNLSDAEFKTLVVKKNQDGGVGRHTAPPRTTRTDRKSKGKEVRHQGDEK